MFWAYMVVIQYCIDREYVLCVTHYYIFNVRFSILGHTDYSLVQCSSKCIATDTCCSDSRLGADVFFVLCVR